MDLTHMTGPTYSLTMVTSARKLGPSWACRCAKVVMFVRCVFHALALHFRFFLIVSLFCPSLQPHVRGQYCIIAPSPTLSYIGKSRARIVSSRSYRWRVLHSFEVATCSRPLLSPHSRLCWLSSDSDGVFSWTLYWDHIPWRITYSWKLCMTKVRIFFLLSLVLDGATLVTNGLLEIVKKTFSRGLRYAALSNKNFF